MPISSTFLSYIKTSSDARISIDENFSLKPVYSRKNESISGLQAMYVNEAVTSTAGSLTVHHSFVL